MPEFISSPMRREAANVPLFLRVLALFALPFLPDTSEAQTIVDGTTLTIPGGTTEVVGNGTGTLTITNSGILNIGTGEAPGTLLAGSVAGNGFGTVNFNHNDPNYVFSPILEGYLMVNQIGTGNTVLRGTETLGGLFYVTQGTLTVDGKLSPSTHVSVLSGGTLAGKGTAGGVTVADTGVLSPGGSGETGVLTGAALNLQDASVLSFDLGAPNMAAGVGSDFIDLRTDLAGGSPGTLTLDGILNISDAGGFGVGTYRLINYNGVFQNNGLRVGSVPSGFNPGGLFVDTTVPGQVSLLVTANTEQYWDGSQVTPDGHISGGDGFWTNTDTNWTNSQGTVNGTWAGQTAIFGGRAGSVLVKDSVTIGRMKFVTDGYTVTPAGGSLIIPATGMTIEASENVGVGIYVAFDGTGDLTKSGKGTASITSSSTLRGVLHVNEGLLALRNGEITTYSNVMISEQSGNSARMEVSGNAQLAVLQQNSSPELRVGAAGTGFLDITNGGRLRANQLIVGWYGVGKGTTTVAGAGSLAEIGGASIQQQSKLSVLDGGVVKVSWSTDVIGGLDIAGAGSRMEAGSMTVFNFSGGGPASVTLREGGKLSFVDIYDLRLGYNRSESGSFNTGTLNIGTGGAPGVLEVSRIDVGNGVGNINFNHSATNYTFSQPVVGNFYGRVNLTQSGSGTTTLTGAISPDGTATVSGGTLLVNNTMALRTTVKNGGTLGGTGNITNPVLVESGGTLLGNVSNDLQMKDLTVQGGGELELALGAVTATAPWKSTGNVSLNGLLDLTAQSGFGAGTYRLIDYSGSYTGGGLTMKTVPAGFNAGGFQLDTAGGQVRLVVSNSTEQYWDGSNFSANGQVNGGQGVWTNSGTNWTNAVGNVNGPWGGGTAIFTGDYSLIDVRDDVTFNKLSFRTSGMGTYLEGSGKLIATPNAVIEMLGTGPTTIRNTIDAQAGLSVQGGYLMWSGTANVPGGVTLNAKLEYTGTLNTPTLRVEGGSLKANGTINGAVVFDRGVGTLFAYQGNLVEANSLELNETTVEAAFERSGGLPTWDISGNLTLSGTLSFPVDARFEPGTYHLFNYGGSLTNNGFTLIPPAMGGDALFLDYTTIGEVNVVAAGGAAPQFWNGTHTTPDGIVHGGSGTWSAGNTNWSNGAGTVSSTWAGTNAVFAGTPGAVSVASAAEFSMLQFLKDGYELTNGGGSLSGTGEILTSIGVGAKISAPIVGEGSMRKTGAGTLTLAAANSFAGGLRVEEGTLVAAISGALGSGTVLVDASGLDSIRPVGSVLQVNSGVTLNNAITLNNRAVLNNAGSIVRTGPGQIAVNSSEGEATINNSGVIRGFTHGIDILTGTVNNSGTGTTIGALDSGISGNTSSAVNLRGFGAVNNTNGATIVGSFPGYGVSFQAGGTLLNDSAVINSNNDAIHTKGATEIVNQNSSSITSSVSGIRLENGGTVSNRNLSMISGRYGVQADDFATLSNITDSTITGATIAVWLKKGGIIENGAGATIKNLGLSPTDKNAIMIEGGAGKLSNGGTILGDVTMSSAYANEVTLFNGSEIKGALDMGTHAGSKLRLSGEAGEQLFSKAVAGAFQSKGLLTKEGAGTWILDTADMDVASLAISKGMLVVRNTLVAGGVDLSGGKLDVRGTVDSVGQTRIGSQNAGEDGTASVSGAGSIFHTGHVAVGGNGGKGTLEISNGGAVSTYGHASIGDAASASSSVTVSGVVSNWTISGDLTMSAGSLSIKNGGMVIADSLNFVAAEGVQRMVSIDGSNSVLTTARPIDLMGSTLTVSNNGFVIPGFEPNSSVAYLAVTGDGVVNIGAAQGTEPAAPGLVVADVVALGPKFMDPFGGTVNFNHTASGYHFAPSFSGNGTINVLAGTTILDADSAFNARINVKGGTLLVNGALSGTTQPYITTTVESGAALGGTGSLGGSVTIRDGGSLVVGDGASAGHFTVDTLSLNPGSNLDYFLGEANVVGGPKNSLLTVDSALVLDGILNIEDSGGFGPGSYRLINYGGSLTNNGLRLGSLPGLPASYTIQTNIDGQVNLIVDTSKPVQFWNGTTASPDGRIHGGSGTWNSSITNWTNSGGTFSSEWKSGFAVFTGTGGNVSVQGNLDFEGMQFAVNGYILSDGGGKLNAKGAALIRVDTEVAAAISAEISGTGSITKTGAGTLTLAKQNTFAGGTRVEAGTLVAAISGALSSGPVVVDAAGGTNSTLQVNSGVMFENAITLNNGAVLNNSGIIQRTGTGQVAVTSSEGDATINNTGGSIRGFKYGVDILSGTVNNSGAAASITARDIVTAGNESSAVNFRGVGTLRNTGRASISGMFPGYGVTFQAGGTVINDNASIGSNNDAIHAKGNMQILNENFGIILSGVSGIRLENGGMITNRVDSLIQGTFYGVEADESATIVNSYDSEITGGKSAIWLKKGGSIANIEGATISKLDTLFPTDPTIRIEGGAGILENGGVILGDVSMSNDHANKAVLHIGSEIDGDLLMGAHADSTLNLWGENGEQLLSEAITGDLQFKGSLIKSGGGTWILDKPGMDIGETVVTSGTLVVQQALKTSHVEFTDGKLDVRGDLITGSILGNSGEMEVNGRVTATETKIAGAILSGGGHIESNVLIDATGRLRPGAAGLDGILDIDGNLAISDDAFLDFSLGSPGNTENSQVNVDGDLKLGGKLSILDLPGFGTGEYTLFDYTGDLTQGKLAVVGLPAGFNPGRLSIDLSDEGEVKLVVASTGSNVQYWLGGSGEWRADEPNWTNGNGSIDAAWFGETAAFRGKAGKVTVRGAISFQELIFESGGYSIVSPDGKLVPTGDATIDVKSGAIAMISAPIVGSGGLTKTNGGTLVLGGAVPSSTSHLTVKGGVLDLEGVFSTGGTDVFSGTRLLVKGVLESPVVNNWGWLSVNGLMESSMVSNWGRLSGAGVISGDVVNSGVLAPGNSPGVLTILGNYTQTSSGIFELEVASPSVFDQLIVKGTARLGGTLDVISLSGNRLEYGQAIPFLQASEIEGTFDRIVMPNSATLRGRFWDNDGTGVLLVAPTSYTLAAETPNQTRAARALDKWIGIEDGDIGVVTLALDMLPGELYPQALDAIGPAWYETVADITIEQSQAQGQLLNQQLSAVRLGQRGLRVQGFEAPVIQQKTANDGKKDIISPAADNHWGVWVLGNGIFAKATAPSDIPNYRFDSGGFLVGVDYAWSENFVTGVFAGYEGTYASYANGGRTIINSARFGGYATYGNGGFYANAVAGGGASSYNVKRPIQWATMDRDAFSKPDGGEFFTLLATGYDWRIGNFTLGPAVSAQYTYAGIAPFTETGAESLDLHTGQINANSLRTYIGGRAAYTWMLTEKVAIIPEARMFWQHEFLENPYDIGASLDGGAGPAFSYRTSVPDRDSVYASAGLGLQLGADLNLNFYYTASFGRDDLVSHMISTGINWKF